MLTETKRRSRAGKWLPARALYPFATLVLAAAFSNGYSRIVPTQPLPVLQQTDGIRTLELNTPIKQEATGQATDLYRVSLVTGQYLRVVVDQQGVDVAVTLITPSNERLLKVDGPSGSTGPEPISVIAEQTGEYRIEVRLPDKKPPVGNYVIRLESLRSPTPADNDRVAAEKLFWEAYQLFKQPAIEPKRKALEKFQQALPMFRALNDRSLEYYSSLVVGYIYHFNGEPQKALDFYRQALSLYQAQGNKADEPLLLNNIGGVYETLGESQKALQYYNDALALWSSRKERGQQADTLNNIGATYFYLGDHQKALDYYNQSLTLKRQLGDPVKITNTLKNIAAVYVILGEQTRALEFLNEALEISHRAADIGGEGNTHYFIAYAHAALGETTKALEHYNLALPLQQKAGNRRGEAITLDGMGVAFNSLGQVAKALEYHQQALDLQRSTKDRRAQAVTLEHMGYVHVRSGELDRAARDYDDALSLSQAVGDRREEANVLQGLARVERERGNLNAARKHIEDAIAKIEAVRGQTDTQLRASYLGVKHDAYQFYIDLLMQMHRENPAAGNDATALRISEQAHARSFLEMLSESRVNIRQGVDATLLEREQTLSQQINAKAERLIQARAQNANERVTALSKEISELEDQYQQARAAIRKSSPGYAALTQPQPLGSKEIQAQLDAGTLLLEYSLGEDQSYVWAVTKDSLKTYELPKREVIETAARLFYNLLTARSKSIALESAPQKQARIRQLDLQLFAAGNELSAMLLGPIRSELRAQRLVVVADGALQYVPFAALPLAESSVAQPGGASNGLGSRDRVTANVYRPLILDHEVISLPSASTLAIQREGLRDRKPAPNGVAVIADPVFAATDERLGAAKAKSEIQTENGAATTRIIEHLAEGSALIIRRLKFTRQEADQILAEAPRGKNFRALDFQANRATATGSELSKYRYVHFATHGYVDSERSDLSAIVLSLVDEQGKPQDGFLRAHEIYNLNLPAELVVLSACETGLGKEIKGEGLVGLTRGFMYAGARRVVVSLWNVNDKATAELMARFYRGMLKENKTPAAALRAAQVEMSLQKQWQSPYYWAAFVLQGEWQ